MCEYASDESGITHSTGGQQTVYGLDEQTDIDTIGCSQTFLKGVACLLGGGASSLHSIDIRATQKNKMSLPVSMRDNG